MYISFLNNFPCLFPLHTYTINDITTSGISHEIIYIHIYNYIYMIMSEAMHNEAHSTVTHRDEPAGP